MTDAPTSKPDKRILVGATLWILCLQLFFAERIAGAGFFPSYNYGFQLISDLGVTACRLDLPPVLCSQRHLLMNASFAVQGILMVLGAMLIRRSFNARLGFTAATVVVILSGLGVLWMGLAPDDTAHNVHTVVSAVYPLAGGLAMLLYGGMMLFGPGEMILLGIGSMLASLPVLAGAIIITTGGIALSEKYNLSAGHVQRISIYGLTGWLILMGIVLLARKGRVAPPLPRIYLPPPPPPRMRP